MLLSYNASTVFLWKSLKILMAFDFTQEPQANADYNFLTAPSNTPLTGSSASSSTRSSLSPSSPPSDLPKTGIKHLYKQKSSPTSPALNNTHARIDAGFQLLSLLYQTDLLPSVCSIYNTFRYSVVNSKTRFFVCGSTTTAMC